MVSGVASQSLPSSFAVVVANPATKPGEAVKQKQMQGEQGPAPVGGNGFGTTGVQRQKIQSGGGEQGPSGTANDPTGFGANNVKSQQIQKGNQGQQGQRYLGPIINVSTPSTTDNYIWIDNVGPWRNWVSNWHVTSGSHYITIDRYS